MAKKNNVRRGMMPYVFYYFAMVVLIYFKFFRSKNSCFNL
jgi:hypothetical protein